MTLNPITSRERVLVALEHREPDRLPVDIGGGLCSISQFAYRKLLAHLGWDEEVEIGGLLTQVVKPSPRMLALLGSDIMHISASPPDVKLGRTLEGSLDDPFEGFVSGLGKKHTFMDEWGVVWRRAAYYYDMVDFPMKDLGTLEDLERYQIPDPRDPGRVRGLRERACAARETGCAVTLDPLAGGLLEMASSIRGHSNFYMDMVANQEFANSLLDRITDFFVAFYETALAAAGDTIDIVFFGDDYGTQQNMIISLRMWRQMIKPRLARLIHAIKNQANVRYQHHSCGAIAPILPDLIEIGVDILNPLQPSAQGMDLPNIKSEFGNRLVLHGAIDQQGTLPHGTPLEVRQEVARRVHDLAPGGGYIVAVSPNIQADVPPENILVLFQTVKELGIYPVHPHS
jgi:uroporphyrinogen decarboxylase